MKIEIVSVEESKTTNTVETKVESIKSAIAVPETETIKDKETTNLEDIFARFLMMEVGDGAASADTIRNYLSQTKQYLNWCRDNLLSLTEAEPEDIKLYRQHLVNSGYANSTIATKLNIIRIFYKAAQAHGLISNNPVAKVKAPKDRKDPAARITFMEAEELKYLFDYLQSQLERARTNKEKLNLLRDRVLIGIMSLIVHRCQLRYEPLLLHSVDRKERDRQYFVYWATFFFNSHLF